MNTETQIICSGFGGQGILTFGLILAYTAMETEHEVTWIPSYGSEMRGGTASCSIKISKRAIASPFISNVDILVAMNEPSVDKFESSLKSGGLILVNTDIVGARKYCDDINVYGLNANHVAVEIGNMRGAGIAMMGALLRCTKLFDKDETGDAIDKFFLNKGKNNPLNRACFERGFEGVDSISLASDR